MQSSCHSERGPRSNLSEATRLRGAPEQEPYLALKGYSPPLNLDSSPVETVPERLEPLTEPVELDRVEAISEVGTAVEQPWLARARTRPGRRHRVSAAVRQELLWVAVIYLGARVLLLAAAFVDGSFPHHTFLNELSNWDGLWYREVANGYLDHLSHAQTTLGFFPLFPIAIWIAEPVFTLTAHDPIWSATVAGALISTIGGLIATILVYRLATGWWGRESARRATILFCVFPGSVVFSMVYSEGLLLPLAAGCIYALERRRWLLAGILAGLGTAVQPTGLVLIPVCAISALLELRRRGWSLAHAKRTVVAPALSLIGVSAFALFLWAWTGTPFANYQAQHFGWREKTDPLAIVHLATMLASQISFTHLNEPSINLNLVVGLVGALLLLGMLVLVFLGRRQMSVEAIAWTLGISFLALTSEFVPPNPRLLITAFPAIMVAGHYIKGKWFNLLVWANGLLLVVLSVLTFYGTTLRP